MRGLLVMTCLASRKVDFVRFYLSFDLSNLSSRFHRLHFCLGYDPVKSSGMRALIMFHVTISILRVILSHVKNRRVRKHDLCFLLVSGQEEFVNMKMTYQRAIEFSKFLQSAVDAAYSTAHTNTIILVEYQFRLRPVRDFFDDGF